MSCDIKRPTSYAVMDRLSVLSEGYNFTWRFDPERLAFVIERVPPISKDIKDYIRSSINFISGGSILLIFGDEE